jgi:dimethylglycine dehydrogenase
LEALSAELGTIVLAGPRSREILGQVTGADVSDVGFPWLSAQHIQVDSTPLLALRTSRVGGIGWEFHVPVARLAAVYEKLWRAGKECGLHDVGVFAMESLELETCRRGWKTELGSECSPLEASLDPFIDFARPISSDGPR